MTVINKHDFNEDHITKTSFKLDRNYNWPVVYIIKGEKYVYIGETSNAFKRTKDHLKNPERIQHLNQIYILYDIEYNKSATLDIESQLIQYIAAEGSLKLQNRNDGLKNHHYFEREKYRAKFESLRQELRKRNIVYTDLEQIRNSDLFKYSPYKSLNEDQEEIVNSIYQEIEQENDGTYIIKGEPGTGKSVVASYLMKYIRSNEATKNLQIALVIPMVGLRKTFKKVFKNIEGLKSSMVIGPFDLAKKYTKENPMPYDVIIVDESHRLQKRKGITNYKAHDNLNKKLGMPIESTQLDRVCKLAKTQILLYDANQSIKPADVNEEDFRKGVSKTFELKSQMRVQGGNQYLDFVHNLLENKPADLQGIKNYEIKLYNDFHEFRKSIIDQDKKHGLSRIVAGYAWPWNSKKDPHQHDIEIDGYKLFWNSTNADWVNSPNSLHEVGCIHTVQGYDLNYVGVILGEEISYDHDKKEFIINRDRYHDVKGKSGINKEYELKRYIINIYKTLMTRGIMGTYIYAVDESVRRYLQGIIK